jgi:hypothetical protein
MRVLWILFAQFLLALAGVIAYCCWPRYLVLPKLPDAPQLSYVNDTPVVSWRGRFLVGRLGEFDNALSAYLMFDYFKAQKPLRGADVMLTIDRSADESPYGILVRLPDDLISGIAQLADLEAAHLASRLDYRWVGRSDLARAMHQTKLFEVAYSEPDAPALDQISPAELRSYLSHFIHFKAATDPRTWRKSAWPLSPITMAEADRLAGDITTVAEFYGLPVDVFLGIGAMENNFLNAPGDLNNAVWKKRAERDDIVLERLRHKVRILNSAIGVWQITRQSLRHAQKLYLADKRDYSLLPERLRPPKRLDMEGLNPDVLTTYAGLLLRDLVDRFDGDVIMATGAYNGTIRHPNLRYAEGVEMVAGYARRVIGNTAELKSMAAARNASVEHKQPAETAAEVSIDFQP